MSRPEAAGRGRRTGGLEREQHLLLSDGDFPGVRVG
jgi:hypothetical protein